MTEMFNYNNEIDVIKEFVSGHVNSNSDTAFVPKWRENERDRIRTCNPQIRSLMPYPLGHTPCSSKDDLLVFQVLNQSDISG